MCNNTFILVLLFILKILVFIVPIGIFVLKKLDFIEKLIRYLYIFEIVMLLLLIVLCLFGRDCIKNSSISGIKLNHKMFDKVNYIYEESTAIDKTNINPSKVYTSNSNKDVNYYNINLYPLKDLSIQCDNKSYFQNYGNDIAALATAMSSTKNKDINPYDILDYLTRSNSLSCDKTINSIDLMYSITNLYGISIREISNLELTAEINQGKMVLGKTKINSDKNFSCGENLIVIYSFNTKNEFSILNPSERTSDYFCPSNSKGYGSIVLGNQNNSTYDYKELSNYISNFYVLEVN